MRWQKWFFRNTAAEPAPIILDRRRIYILPTGAGLLFAIVLVAMYVGAINYNLGLGHALVFLLAGLGSVAMLHTYRNLVRIEITPGRADPVFVGERLTYRLYLRNPSAQRRFSLTVKGDGGLAEAAVLDAGGTRQVDLAIPVHRRGRHAIGRLRIHSHYPMGLFEAWSYPFPDASGLVFPQPIHSDLPPPTPSDRPGIAQGESGDEDFSGFRTRQPSDSPRHVAWKAFARDPDHQPLLVKTFAGGTTPELWLDWNRMPGDEDDETRLSRICGWILQADRDGVRYGLRIPGCEIAPDEGAPHRDACLEKLALFETPKANR
jgi:uncharacterized protein (DUF58 family)